MRTNTGSRGSARAAGPSPGSRRPSASQIHQHDVRPQLLDERRPLHRHWPLRRRRPCRAWSTAACGALPKQRLIVGDDDCCHRQLDAEREALLVPCGSSRGPLTARPAGGSPAARADCPPVSPTAPLSESGHRGAPGQCRGSVSLPISDVGRVGVLADVGGALRAWCGAEQVPNRGAHRSRCARRVVEAIRFAMLCIYSLQHIALT